MKKKLLLASVLLSIPIMMAAITGSGLNDSALGSLYCALTGCTFTGAVTMDNSSMMRSDPSDAKFYVSHIDAGDNEIFMKMQVTSQCQIGCYDDDLPAVGTLDDLIMDVAKFTVDTDGGNDELTIDNKTVELTHSLLHLKDGMGSAALPAASECNEAAEGGKIWYNAIGTGSGLCICMFNGSAYEIKATLTLGTFADGDCDTE